MSDPSYAELIAAGYAPAQILSCVPCKCKDSIAAGGTHVKDCTFPTHRGGQPIEEPR